MAALTQIPIQLRRLKAAPSLINKLTERCLGRAVNGATQRALTVRFLVYVGLTALFLLTRKRFRVRMTLGTQTTYIDTTNRCANIHSIIKPAVFRLA
jgi:hypothetical protein